MYKVTFKQDNEETPYVTEEFETLELAQKWADENGNRIEMVRLKQEPTPNLDD
jgi:hypothetical protein